MDEMSQVRTYVVGRDGTCDVRLDDPSVSRRHAEVVRVSGGCLYVTDCATTNGTFVLAGREWQAIRQSLVKPTDRLRFGECEVTVDRLDAMCARGDAGPSDGRHVDPARAGPTPPPEAGPDPARGLEFDPETGEVIEKTPGRGRGRRE